MRRFVSISWVSLVVSASAVVVVAAGPTGRLLLESVRAENDLYPRRLGERLQEAAERRPEDAQAWLAAGVAAGNPPSSRAPDRKAFARVFELKPDWPAPYLLLSGHLMSGLPRIWRRELVPFVPRWAEQARWRAKPLTAQQRAEIARVRDLLQKARSLDTGNAAPDYMLADLALVERRDDDALALLRSGMTKGHWSIGEREASIAVYATARRFLPGLWANLSASTTPGARGFAAGVRPRELARALTGMSALAMERSDHQRAIFLREADLHLGWLMMANGYTMLDVLVGKAVWTIGAGERLSPAEEAAAVKGLPRVRGQGDERQRQATTTARVAKLARYLREHGRADLAAEILSFNQHLFKWDERLDAAMSEYMEGWGVVFRPLAAMSAIVVAAGAALAWLVIWGLAYGVMRVAKRPPVPVTWPRWKWALVALGCLGIPGGAVVAQRAWVSLPPYAYLPGILDRWPVPWPVTAAFDGLVLLPLAVVVVAWRVRRRQAPSERPGFGRQYVGTVMAVLLPVAALVLLAAAVATVPAHAQLNKGVGRLNVMIYESELDYHGLAPPTAGMARQ